MKASFAGDWQIRNPPGHRREWASWTIPRDCFRWSAGLKGLSGEALVPASQR